MQKLKLIDIKKLPKASSLVCEETDELLQQALAAMASQEDFFRQMGVEPEMLGKIINNYQSSDENDQALSHWKTQFYGELMQAGAQKKKEMKLAERLLMPKKKNPPKKGGTQRCTRIF
ncbi:hypothetical protein N9V90_02120 [Endozoicomonas sp.]|nr:hypothetical protein [Endozoicomonas sp.]